MSDESITIHLKESKLTICIIPELIYRSAASESDYFITLNVTVSFETPIRTVSPS